MSPWEFLGWLLAFYLVAGTLLMMFVVLYGVYSEIRAKFRRKAARKSHAPTGANKNYMIGQDFYAQERKN